MRNLVRQLSLYAAYHRHPRNVRIHCVGIPLMVVATAVLLSRPSVLAMGWVFTPALAVWFGAWSAVGCGRHGCTAYEDKDAS